MADRINYRLLDLRRELRKTVKLSQAGKPSSKPQKDEILMKYIL
jgi:hypothetical protein